MEKPPHAVVAQGAAPAKATMPQDAPAKARKTIVYAVPAVERAMSVFYYLRDKKSATVSSISSDLAITRSNCFAILKTLQKHNFLTFDHENKKYALGIAFVDFSRAIAQDLEIIRLARPWLAHLAARTGMSALIAQRVSEGRLMVLDQEVASNGDVRLSVALGRRIPITYSATGRAVLAFLADEQIGRLVSGIRLQQSTPRTMVDAADILRDVQRTRTLGYSVAVEESMIGVTALGAPVFNSAGEPVAALSIFGISAGMPKVRIRVLGETLLRTASEVTTAINGRRPAGHPPEPATLKKVGRPPT